VKMKATLNIHDLQIIIATAMKNLSEKGWLFSDGAAIDALMATRNAKTLAAAIDAIELSLSASSSKIRA